MKPAIPRKEHKLLTNHIELRRYARLMQPFAIKQNPFTVNYNPESVSYYPGNWLTSFGTDEKQKINVAATVMRDAAMW